MGVSSAWTNTFPQAPAVLVWQPALWSHGGAQRSTQCLWHPQGQVHGSLTPAPHRLCPLLVVLDWKCHPGSGKLLSNNSCVSLILSPVQEKGLANQ